MKTFSLFLAKTEQKNDKLTQFKCLIVGFQNPKDYKINLEKKTDFEINH